MFAEHIVDVLVDELGVEMLSCFIFLHVMMYVEKNLIESNFCCVCLHVCSVKKRNHTYLAII